MLKILNDLKPFFEDCYREIAVREYSRLIKITPPTASKLLKEFEEQDLLKSRLERGYLLFRANRESPFLKDLSRIYWRIKLSQLINYLSTEFHNPTIILFGSLSKLESREESDIDVAVIIKVNKKVNLSKFEKAYKRKIQIFNFKSFNQIGKELKTNILNGYLINGEMS